MEPAKASLLAGILLTACGDAVETTTPPRGCADLPAPDGLGESFELDGCWDSSASIGSEESSLRIKSGFGTAALYFYIGEQLYFATFTVTVTIGESGDESSTSEASGSSLYLLRMECEPDSKIYDEYGVESPEPCSELDFLMSCSLEPGFSPELTCTTEASTWSSASLVWEKTG